ncbi:unnamed protein product [Miscanthus lutarioriparius]|uniref:Uncharacterized protein n=1 Tax=Miscanthus lutarioriparius TaxID=422564 RepID=A0A811Q3Z9_9POAL|nr:unnamed protein product [Miscanthus lutarioriparius]
MTVFTKDCDRHLKRKEEEAASMAQPAGAKKKRKKATVEKRKEAIASDSSDSAVEEEDGSLFKEGEMLKLREEYWEAALLWEEKLVPRVLDHWLERKITQVPTVDSNKKKVGRIIMPNAYIKDIIENPNMMRELSNEEMAECLQEYRQSYATAKVINTKNHTY